MQSTRAYSAFSIAARMTAVREAFKCQRQARLFQRLWRFHCEFNQLDAAKDVRILVLEQLRAACQGWRAALGFGHAEPLLLGAGPAVNDGSVRPVTLLPIG